MQKLVWKNSIGDEIDLTSGSYGITEWEGFANTSLNIQSQEVPFQDGGVFLDALMEQRELSVTLAINDKGNLETRYKLRRELIHILNPKLGEGYLIYTNDFISKRIKCVAQIPLFETHNSNDSGTPKASLAWTACEPYWEDLEETEVTLSLGETKKITNEGDFPAQMKIYINNGAVNPQIKNNTTQKEIKLLGDFNKNIEIDTNIGNKKVISMDMSLRYIYGNFASKMIKKDGELFLYGTKIAKLDSFGNIIFYNPSNEEITSACLFNNKVIACGIEYFHISDDGINFRTVSNPVEAYMYDICTNGIDKIISVGAGGKIVTSSDSGETWQEQTSGVDWQLEKIVYVSFLDIYIAISQYGILTSPDGVSWIKYENYHLYSIACNNDIIICCGYDESLRYVLVVSVDGENWNSIITDKRILNIIFDGKKFICCEEESPNINGVNIYSTSDGTDLTLISANNKTISSDQLYYFSNIYYSINQTISTSIDLVEWNTKEPIVEYSPYFSKIVYDGKNFISFGNFQKSIISSKDGENWNFITKVQENTFMTAFSYGKGIYLLGGRNGKILISRDLLNWDTIESGTSYQIINIRFIENKFYAVGYGGICMVSEDGIDWTIYTVGNVNFVNYDIEYFNGYFYICNTHGEVLRTNDFENIEISIPYSTGNQLKSIAKNKNKLVVVGSIIASTTNGTDWTISEVNGDYNRVLFSDNIFIAVGHKTKISTNGINWDELSGGARFLDIAFHEKFVLVGEYNIYVTEYKEGSNIISSLSENSDMSLNLKQGENQFQFNCDNDTELYARLVYRQKYIGV